MINRNNKKLIDQYIQDIREEDDINEDSLRVTKTQLLLLLEFANEIEFKDLPKKHSAKAFKDYLVSQNSRRDGKKNKLANAYCRKVVATAARFLDWLQTQNGYRMCFTFKWLRGFKSKKTFQKNTNETDEDLETPKYFSLEEIMSIAKTPVSSLNEERIRAALVFLYLSGMRITAFLTMPIKAVNLQNRTVRQSPAIGMHTKLGKKGTTRLLKVPELLPYIQEWDDIVRSKFLPTTMWFTPISPSSGCLDQNYTPGKHRDSGFRNDMKLFLEKAGVEYRCPHTLRHTHIRHARDKAQNNVKSLEAIANNALQTPETMLKYGRLNQEESLEEMDKLFDKNINSSPTNGDGSKITQDPKVFEALAVLANYFQQNTKEN